MTQKISVAVKEEKIDDTLMPEVHVSEASMELQNHVVILFSVIISLCSYYRGLKESSKQRLKIQLKN